jgi:murein DD-endopeptidase MepM/ murein hydrolase activator NlpD
MKSKAKKASIVVMARTGLCLALILMAVFGCFSDITLAGSGMSDLSAKRTELTSLQSKIEQIKQTLSLKSKQEKDALRALQRTEEELLAIESKIEQTEKKLKDAEQKLVQTKAELVKAEQQLEAATDQYESSLQSLEDRLVFIYKLGPGLMLELLLGSSSFADFVTRYDYLGVIARQDAEVYAQIRAEKEALEEHREEMRARKAELEETSREIALLSSSLAEQKRSIQPVLAQRSQYASRVSEERERWERELAEEERASRELEQTIREMQARFGESGEVMKWTGKFIWPVQARRISDLFGWRVHPIYKTRRFHSGMDLAASTGTPVKAAADGRVLLAGWVKGYGNTVIIDHGGGLSTLYGHNSSITTKAGKMVLQGDIIAKVGSTGVSTGPHLHFEVRQDGTPQDPMRWLP